MKDSESSSHDILGRLVKNSFFLIVSRISDVAVALVTIPVIARYLGLKTFGDYALVLAIAIFVKPLAEFGSENIICREVANNKTAAPEFVASAFISRALSSGLIMFVLYLLLDIVAPDKSVKQAILISAGTEVSLSFCTILLAVITAYERMEYELLCKFFYHLVFILGITAVILFDLGFTALFYARFFSSLIFLLFGAFFVFKYLLPVKKEFSWHIIRFIYKEAFPLAIFTLLITASSKVDVFFLGYFKGPADIALFEVPSRLITQLQFVPLSINVSMFAFFARAAEASTEALHEHYDRAARFLYIFSVFPAILIFLGAETIIRLLFGDKFIASALALKILCWSFIVFSLVHFFQHILIVLGRQRVIVLLVGASFVSNILLDVWLVPLYGYIGASIASLTASLILFALTVICVSGHAGRLNASTVFLKPTASALSAGAVCYFLITNSFTSLLVGAFFGLLIYISMLFALKTFEKTELRLVREAFFRKIKTGERQQ